MFMYSDIEINTDADKIGKYAGSEQANYGRMNRVPVESLIISFTPLGTMAESTSPCCQVLHWLELS